MTKPTIKRALVAGLGSIGQRHLRLLRARLPDAQIMVLRHGSCAETVEGANACTNSLNDAVAFEPDVAIIASPANARAEQAIALARAGAHPC